MHRIHGRVSKACAHLSSGLKSSLLILMAIAGSAVQSHAANVLLLVGNTTLGAGDKAVQDTLKNMGHTVTVKTGLASVAADTAGKALIVITSTIVPADVGTKFLSVKTPILAWEGGTFSALKMTGTVSGTDFGTLLTQTTIKILLPAHAMAAGQTGTPTVLNSADTVTWGKPATTAFKVAQINSATVTDSVKATIFGYEEGAAMVGQNATGRRVGFFLDDDGAGKWSASGKTLFRAAVNWAITGSAPYFITPPAPQTVLETATATFTVSALGKTPVTYQWLKNNVAISGATGASYTTPATVMGDNGASFTVAVTNSVGTTTSPAAILTVTARPPVFTTQPASQTVNENQTASFSVAVSGTAPITYAWKKGGVAITGATSAAYTTPATTMADSNAQFTCTAANAGATVTSNVAVLTVKPLPPVLAPLVSNSPANDGDSAKFSVTITSGTPPFTYQWQRATVNISGATASSYKFFPARLSDNNAAIRCIVTGRGGPATSNTVTLQVNPLPVAIIKQPQGRTVYEGQKASFSVSATGSAPLSFQWQLNQANINGATDSLYTTPTLLASDSGASYRCVVTNPGGSLASSPAVLSVRAYSKFPVSQWIGVSAELRDDLGNPVGKGAAVEKDMVVKLFTNLTGGTAAYQEDFTAAGGQPIKVQDGFFTLYLGSGAGNGNLNQILTANPSLFAEVAIGQGASQEILSPRTPITSPAYQGAPQILKGSGNPSATAPAGSYYEDTDNGAVWLRLPVRWTQVSN